MYLHEKNDFNKKGIKLDLRDKRSLLPNATHYIIVDTTVIFYPEPESNDCIRIDEVKGEKIIQKFSSLLFN